MNTDFPLSGDVTQFFKLWAKYLSQQTGFVNINNVMSADPETEKRIIEEAAGYGQQLGRIVDALDVVMRKLALDKIPTDLSEEDRKVVVRFSDLKDRIENIKHGQREEKIAAAGA